MVNDIGWHLIDTVIGLLGDGSVPSVKHAELSQTRNHQLYDCEDSAHITIAVRSKDPLEETRVVPCILSISRVGCEKTDELAFVGDHGTLVAKGGKIILRTSQDSDTCFLQQSVLKQNDFANMLKAFATSATDGLQDDECRRLSSQDLVVTRCIAAIYGWANNTQELTVARRSSPTDPRGSGIGVNNSKHLGKAMQWPRITPEVEAEVQAQLHRSLSIYDNSGIIQTFEEEFRNRHDPTHSSLLFNSGTNAMQSIYFAAQLRPGDEVSSSESSQNSLIILMAFTS